MANYILISSPSIYSSTTFPLCSTSANYNFNWCPFETGNRSTLKEESAAGNEILLFELLTGDYWGERERELENKGKTVQEEE